MIRTVLYRYPKRVLYIGVTYIIGILKVLIKYSKSSN